MSQTASFTAMVGPLVIAHRGASALRPENTLEAFQLAMELGADGVEFDVQLTRDRVVVVFHDEVLGRTSSGSGVLAEQNFADLAGLDAGSWFGSDFGGCRIPSLETTLSTLGGQGLMNIELKPRRSDAASPTETSVLVEKTVAAVIEKGLADEVVFSSFDYTALDQLRSLFAGARIAVLSVPKNMEEAFTVAGRLGAELINPHVAVTDRALVERAHRAGLGVGVWTVNEESEIKRIKSLGVQMLFTDHPGQA
ncbi:MAG: glycerophosphodiester phosphodiesterase family protein [Deltaproteobacteria bacterium]